ncbi:MAG: C-terminal binding protein [Herbiconiux sp.]|nr:C-terminal binding protein [Herbiconiux sp.]
MSDVFAGTAPERAVPDARATHEIGYVGIGDDLGQERRWLDGWGLAHAVTVQNVDLDGGDRGLLAEQLSGFDALVVEGIEVDRPLLERLPGLRIVALQSIGTDSVDLDAAAELAVAVSNAPGFCTEEVAAHTVALILDVVRQVSFYDREVRAGGWEPLPGGRGLPLRPSGLTVGLVYFGSIPQRVVPVLAALGMSVGVFAPSKSAADLAGWGVRRFDTLEELLRESDVVSLHAPLIPATRHLIGAAELAVMKPGAYLVNTARGGLVDEVALVDALESGVIAGAALDVIDDESSGSTCLRRLPQVVMTPHTGYLSEESALSARRMALESVVDVLVHGRSPRFAAHPREAGGAGDAGGAGEAGGAADVPGAPGRRA